MASNSRNSARATLRKGATRKIWDRKWSFLAVFLLALFASTSVLAALDLLPEPEGGVVNEPKPSLSAAASLAQAESQLPIKIEIPKLERELTVVNPTTTDIAVLDRALLDGAVRYPTSGKLGENGNVVIFGHSSYLPIVRNSAFKAFNGIEELQEDDRILVTGSSRTFVYEVDSVSRASAEEDAIPLTISGSKLTLATCDSFGSKSDRFVVTATLVESYPVGT